MSLWFFSPPVPQSHSPPSASGPQLGLQPCSWLRRSGCPSLTSKSVQYPPPQAVPPRASHGARSFPICSKQIGCHGHFTEEEENLVSQQQHEGRGKCLLSLPRQRRRGNSIKSLCLPPLLLPLSLEHVPDMGQPLLLAFGWVGLGVVGRCSE